LPPAFARRTFLQQFHARRRSEEPSRAADVLLFPDTFTNYHEPAIGLAAVELLERAGCVVAVDVPDGGDSAALTCCGRPFISNGLLADAVAQVERNVLRLHRWADEGKSIIACEPSCILTLKDDYPALLRGPMRRRAETVASVCRTFEEFLEERLRQRDKGGEAPLLPLRPETGPILVQAHCHQRSLIGTTALLSLLRRVGAAEVMDLDAGCCGLAGSFGYEKEHYDVSIQVAEQRLLPALRPAPARAVVVASGFSCRMQIAHCTGRAAVHPAEFLRGAVP
jgi:Fe-S oxidoreductase